MKILVVGGSGVLGRRVIPLLIDDGHEVVATRRHPEKDVVLPEGARYCSLDLLDEAAVNALLAAEKPQVALHLATAMPANLHPRKLRKQLAATNRLREAGTRNLVAAANAAGVQRIVAESIAFAYAPGAGAADENAPLIQESLAGFGAAVEAVQRMEACVQAHFTEYLVLRLGMLYGPGTAYAADSANADTVRKRGFPIAGPGAGRFSFLHVADAANAFCRAVTSTKGTYNVCENRNPAIAEWLPAYAAALGAPEPIRVPRWLGRLAAGPFGDYLMNRQRGASNRRAAEVLDWQPRRDFLSAPLGE